MKNQTIRELYREYRDELAQLIVIAESSPRQFDDVNIMTMFNLQSEKLAALVTLYAGLIEAVSHKRRGLKRKW